MGTARLPDGKVILTLDRALGNTHPGGTTTFDAPTGTFRMSTSAEVLRLTRNVRITGEGHVSTDVLGSSGNELAFRGAATQLTGKGTMNIEGVELDHCGKQSHMGRYCLHFHLAGNCSTCTFSHNAVHHTFQRGITVHGTHYSTVADNAIYNVRGAGIYMEDGNEWSNYVLDNAATCLGWHHCKISPNTWVTANGLQQDYMEQGGIWGVSPSNVYIGNRMSMHENGFFIDSKNPFADGQGLAQNRICANKQPVLTIRSNVQHSNTGFGFYLNENWPKRLDTTANGLLRDDSYASCRWFTDDGEDNGQVGFIENNFDWLNNFVGAYDQGDIAYRGQVSFQNNHGMYWKTTKNFARAPKQAHIEDGLFLDNNLFLGPGGHGTFAFRNTTIRQRTIESNHHCNEGSLGASGSVVCAAVHVRRQLLLARHGRKRIHVPVRVWFTRCRHFVAVQQVQQRLHTEEFERVRHAVRTHQCRAGHGLLLCRHRGCTPAAAEVLFVVAMFDERCAKLSDAQSARMSKRQAATPVSMVGRCFHERSGDDCSLERRPVVHRHSQDKHR